MEEPEDPLGREEPVGDEADEEWRDDRRDRVDRERPVRERLHPLVLHEDRNGRVPRAPDEELQEHHYRESRPDSAHGSTLILMLRSHSAPSWSPWRPM